MAYSVSYLDPFRRAATDVHRILKGAKPADLPVEQPPKLEFVPTQKTAPGARPDDPAVGATARG
jgi:putative ABC transport system substrate-binding protein